LNSETEVLHNLAQSFYTFFRTGVFRSQQIDISKLTLEQAYECQHYYHQLRIADGDTPVGYKVGCTSTAIREQFGVDEPICGLIMTPGLLREGDLIDSNNYCQLAIEPEFVITLKQDLAKVPISDRALLDAIEFVQPGIELHNYVYHFSPLKQQEVICSNGIHAAQLVGNNKVRASKVHWHLEGVAVFKNGELVASGVAADIMGSPLNSLRFLIEHLRKRGEGLKVGELVIPGSATALISVVAGDEITCSFTNVGSVTMKVV
jgi:2-keto-4-pentenoate hydratase